MYSLGLLWWYINIVSVDGFLRALPEPVLTKNTDVLLCYWAQWVIKQSHRPIVFDLGHNRNMVLCYKTASNVTIGFDLGHDLNPEFWRSNMDFAISYDKMVRLPRNEKWKYRLNTRPQMCHRFWPWSWPWPYLFKVKVFNNSVSQEWQGRLMLNEKEVDRLLAEPTMWPWLLTTPKPWPWISKVKFFQ